MSSVRDEVAKNIRYHRKKNKYTQKELAEALGVTPSAVSNWENGENSIDIDTLVKICDLFEATLNDMYGIYCDENGYPRDPDEKSPITHKGIELTEQSLTILKFFQDMTPEKQAVYLEIVQAIAKLQKL